MIIFQNKGYFKIPIQLCFYIAEYGLYRPFQLFLLLKIVCHDKFRLTKELKAELASKLHYKSIRSIENNIKILRNQNFIGFNPKSRVYFIRGFDTIRLKMEFCRRRSALWDYENIDQTKGFVIGAIVGDLIDTQKRGIRKTERLKGRSNQTFKIPSFLPIASKGLAKILNVSPKQGDLLKRIAADERYISIKNDFEIIGRSTKRFQPHLKGHYAAHRIKRKGDFLVIDKPDMVKSYIHFRKRKKFTSL